MPKVEGMDLDGAFSIATDGFRLFDTSSDGAIVLKEMGKALGQVDIETLQARMGEADVDDNGYVTFPEFRASPCPRIQPAPQSCRADDFLRLQWAGSTRGRRKMRTKGT